MNVPSEDLAIGVITHQPSSPARFPMSLVVGVASMHAVALATDSVFVELPSGMVARDHVKHVRVGSRAGGIVGSATWRGYHVLDWLQRALDEALSVNLV